VQLGQRSLARSAGPAAALERLQYLGREADGEAGGADDQRQPFVEPVVEQCLGRRDHGHGHGEDRRELQAVLAPRRGTGSEHGPRMAVPARHA
jgi:hypothetical protein